MTKASWLLARGTVPADFRQQAASALMHPVTLGALAVLLVNDWLLKPLWQSDWTTGKFSDLAWMVFAPPVLAYILSFVTLGHARANRAAFVAAYVGLPLLYVAFNTFAPVHDAILWVLGLFGGNGPRSPLDPADSLVIPLAMAAALWVWRKPPLKPEALRARLALLVAVVAAFASIATSYATELGATHVGRTETGALGVYTEPAFPDYGGSFQSPDGGLTWKRIGPEFVPLETQESSEREVKTPSGSYFIVVGHSIVRRDTASGDEEEIYDEIYSFQYFQNGGNRWLQALDKRDIDDRVITTSPLNLFYDDQSGNLIAAMGIQGMVVIAPDGTATRVAVGRYSPTDFSLRNKVRTYFSALLDPSSITFIVVALLLALTFASLGLAGPTGPVGPWLCFTISTVMTAALALTVGVYPYVSQYPWEGDGMIIWQILTVFGSAYGLIPLLLTGIGLLWVRAGRKQLLAIAAATFAMLLLILLGALVLFQMGNGAANLVAVGLVGVAAFGLWLHQSRALA